MSAIMTLSEDGTLTLDRELIDYIQAAAGDAIVVEKLPGRSLRLGPQKKKLDIMDLAGSLKADVRLSVEEINQGIIEGCLASNKES